MYLTGELTGIPGAGDAGVVGADGREGAARAAGPAGGAGAAMAEQWSNTGQTLVKGGCMVGYWPGVGCAQGGSGLTG